MVEQLKTSERHESMRGWFAYELHGLMRTDDRIWIVTGDLGYGMFDKIKRDFPDRFINVGAAEQAMMGVGVGMAIEGKIPVIYSITPFLLYRPFETIRNYVNREGIPVKLVGGGRDRDYGHDGFSHWAEEDRGVLALLPGIDGVWPETKEDLREVLPAIIASPRPVYLNLHR